MLDFILHNAFVLPMTHDLPILEKGWIGIQNGLITHVEPQKTPLVPAKEVIDAQNGIVLPGLVNAHTHIPMSLFRGMTRDMALQPWLQNYLFPTEANFITPETVVIGTQLSCAEMFLGGITTCCDGYFYEEIIAETLEETGMRAVLGQGILEFPVPGVSDAKDVFPAAQQFAISWKNNSTRITPSIFCHAPYTCSVEILKAAKAFAKNENLLFQIHISETQLENDQYLAQHGISPVEMLARHDLLDNQTLLIHSVWLSDTDIDLISKAGASIAHCPESNMKLASGVMRFEYLVQKKVNLALGTDGCASNNNQDMFGEMDMAAKLHKVTTLHPTTADAGTILSMATRNGANALGLGDKIGTLEVGKQADLIYVNTQKPHLQPIYDPISHIVYAATSQDVDSVWIEGKPIVRNRKLLTIDIDSVFKKLTPVAEQIQEFITTL